jgi:hypothetical protein
MSGGYSRAHDPFMLYDLSKPSPVRAYARYFYNQTAKVTILSASSSSTRITVFLE